MSGCFCMATVFLSVGNASPLLHKPPLFNRAAVLVCDSCLLLNSKEFPTPGLVKEQEPRNSVE